MKKEVYALHEEFNSFGIIDFHKLFGTELLIDFLESSETVFELFFDRLLFEAYLYLTYIDYEMIDYSHDYVSRLFGLPYYQVLDLIEDHIEKGA